MNGTEKNGDHHNEPFEVAVIGGGIVGLALVTGLLHRGVSVKLYEKTSAFRPIGAGIGFTPNTQQALQLLNPGAFEAQQKVTTANGDPKNPNDWLLYLDGYHSDEEELIFKLHAGYRGFEGCVRADFLNEMLKLIPSEVIEFNKSIENIVDLGDDKKIQLHFKDGSTAQADAGKSVSILCMNRSLIAPCFQLLAVMASRVGSGS
jgi:salicylate hydroxylase